MRYKGFTLIELLVVIAIIAILAAILFPVFASAKESAKRTTCLRHGGQLGTALNIYTDDNGGKFPFCWVFSTGTSTKTWAHSLMKYTRSLGVFTCPSVPNRRFTGTTSAIFAGNADRITGGWGYNTSGGDIAGESRENGVGRGKNGNANKQTPYGFSDITSPTQHIAFGDSKLSDDMPEFASQGYTGKAGFCDVIKNTSQGQSLFLLNTDTIMVLHSSSAMVIQNGLTRNISTIGRSTVITGL